MILTPLHKCKTVYGLEVDGIDVYILLLLCPLGPLIGRTLEEK